MAKLDLAAMREHNVAWLKNLKDADYATLACRASDTKKLLDAIERALAIPEADEGASWDRDQTIYAHGFREALERVREALGVDDA